jgi:hypothetical protein
MDKSEKQIVTIEGIDFSYSMRRNYERCMYVCGGLTGLHASGKWSTWSPGRFPIPEADEDFEPAFQKALEPYSRSMPKFAQLVPIASSYAVRTKQSVKSVMRC